MSEFPRPQDAAVQALSALSGVHTQSKSAPKSAEHHQSPVLAVATNGTLVKEMASNKAVA